MPVLVCLVAHAHVLSYPAHLLKVVRMRQASAHTVRGNEDTSVWEAEMNLESFESTIRTLFGQGLSYERISEYIQGVTGRSRGFSTRSVRRFCQERGMMVRSTLCDVDLDHSVSLYV